MTLSASAAKFASFSKYTGICIFSSNFLLISQSCHFPCKFGVVRIFPLIRSNGPGQDIPTPTMSSLNELIVSTILSIVLSGSSTSVKNCILSIIS